MESSQFPKSLGLAPLDLTAVSGCGGIRGEGVVLVGCNHEQMATAKSREVECFQHQPPDKCDVILQYTQWLTRLIPPHSLLASHPYKYWKQLAHETHTNLSNLVIFMENMYGNGSRREQCNYVSPSHSLPIVPKLVVLRNSFECSVISNTNT